MKLIVRADDLGFTEAVNYGLVKTLREGIVTSTGLMPNMPAAEHGFSLVKTLANISLGQHTNIVVGKPVSDPAKIPSLVDEEGNFIRSSVYRSTQGDTVVLDEVIMEIEAQLHRFRDITGRDPDYLEGHAISSPNFEEGLRRVAQKNNLLHLPFLGDSIGGKIVKWSAFPRMTPDCMYNPMAYILNDEGQVLGMSWPFWSFHPGYVDQDILRLSSFNLIRPWEVEVLCSPIIRQWQLDRSILTPVNQRMCGRQCGRTVRLFIPRYASPWRIPILQRADLC